MFRVIFTILLINILSLPSLAKEYNATILSNHDGDTITVSINGKKEKVRLLGVDTAEMGQGTWGKKAKDFTQGLTKGKTAKLETDIQERDKYGRLLAYVYVNNIFVNLELIKQGYAQLLTYSPNVKYVDSFTKAQSQARQNSLGIWGTDGLKQSPYEYRHGGKKNTKVQSVKNNVVTPKVTSNKNSVKVSSKSNTVLVHVNHKSGIYHFAGCRYYDCKNCDIELTEQQAINQGYRHCKKE